MSSKFKSIGLALAFLLSLVSQPVYGQSESDSQQKAVKAAKTYISFFPNNRGLKGCYPAEVTGVTQGAPPPEGIEVVIKNFGWKIINAVKLGWYIAEDEQRTLAGRLLRVPCEGSPLSDQIVLSGETPLIEIGPLYPQQTAAIGKKPLKMLYDRQDRIILTDFDFITLNEVKDLIAEGTARTFKKTYMLMLGVAEAHFADGTIWKPEGVPVPLTLP
jgi:hypothetical protein